MKHWKQTIAVSSIIVVIAVVAFVSGFITGRDQLLLAELDTRKLQIAVHQFAQSAENLYPTGYELLEGVNLYRRSQGKKDLILDDRYCNNIGARAVNYKNTNSHDGLEEFAHKYIYPSGVDNISELLNYGVTVEEIVAGWAGSPSHNIMLLEKNRGCAYSDDGNSVLLLGN